MSSYTFAQEWPGARRAPRHRHRHGPPNWSFTRGGGRGRPPIEDIDELIALGRMWRGGPFGGTGWGPHRRGRGRARRGDVRFALLRLLAEEPRNGYQLIQAIEERSEGLWRPSPGSVYPTLAQLEDEGLIRGIDRDGTKLFEITDQGRDRLSQSSVDPAPWEENEDPDAPDLHRIASAVIQIGKAAWQVAQEGDERQIERAYETLAETRRSLYRILAQDREPEDADAEDTHV